jgi:hypothetical protein
MKGVSALGRLPDSFQVGQLTRPGTLAFEQVQPAFQVELPTSNFDEGALVFRRDFQCLGQQLGQLPGGAAFPHFDLADSMHAAAGALRKLFLGKIQLMAALFDPFTEIKSWLPLHPRRNPMPRRPPPSAT